MNLLGVGNGRVSICIIFGFICSLMMAQNSSLCAFATANSKLKSELNESNRGYTQAKNQSCWNLKLSSSIDWMVKNLHDRCIYKGMRTATDAQSKAQFPKNDFPAYKSTQGIIYSCWSNFLLIDTLNFQNYKIFFLYSK